MSGRRLLLEAAVLGHRRAAAAAAAGGFGGNIALPLRPLLSACRNSALPVRGCGSGMKRYIIDVLEGGEDGKCRAWSHRG